LTPATARALDELRLVAGVDSDEDFEALRLWALRRADELLRERPPAMELRVLLGEASTASSQASAGEPQPVARSQTEEFEVEIDLEEIEELDLDDFEEVEEVDEFEPPADGETVGEPEADVAGATPTGTSATGVPEVVLDPGTWPVAPFRITFTTWHALVETWDAQLRHGAFFVQTDQRLGPDDEAELTFVLPRYRIELTVAARVMQTVPGDTPGYAMQFVGVDDARNEGMRRFVEQARAYEAGTGDVPDPAVLRVTALDDGSFRWHLTAAEQLDLQDMRAEIARMANASPARMLGLDEAADPERARERFFDLAQRWHPRRFAAPEIREIAEAIFLRFETAYREFNDDVARRPSTTPANSESEEVAASRTRTDADLEEAQASRSGVFTGRSNASPTKPRSKRRATSVLAKRLLDSLGGPDARRGKATRPSPPASVSPNPPSSSSSAATSMTDYASVRPSDPAPEDGTSGPVASYERAVSAATDCLQRKHFDEAIELFETALRLRPNAKRARVGHGFARAREAVARKDFVAAATAYRDILDADPKNERAQKEQLLIAAVAPPGGA